MFKKLSRIAISNLLSTINSYKYDGTVLLNVSYDVWRGKTPSVGTVLDLVEAQPMSARTFNFGVYAGCLKELNCGEIKYGGDSDACDHQFTH